MPQQPSRHGLGVSHDSKRRGKQFKARIFYAGSVLHLGRFDTAHLARLAHDQAVRSLRPGLRTGATNYAPGEYEHHDPAVAAKVQSFLRQYPELKPDSPPGSSSTCKLTGTECPGVQGDSSQQPDVALEPGLGSSSPSASEQLWLLPGVEDGACGTSLDASQLLSLDAAELDAWALQQMLSEEPELALAEHAPAEALAGPAGTAQASAASAAAGSSSAGSGALPHALLLNRAHLQHTESACLATSGSSAQASPGLLAPVAVGGMTSCSEAAAFLGLATHRLLELHASVLASSLVGGHSGGSAGPTMLAWMSALRQGAGSSEQPTADARVVQLLGQALLLLTAGLPALGVGSLLHDASQVLLLLEHLGMACLELRRLCESVHEPSQPLSAGLVQGWLARLGACCGSPPGTLAWQLACDLVSGV